MSDQFDPRSPQEVAQELESLVVNWLLAHVRHQVLEVTKNQMLADWVTLEAKLRIETMLREERVRWETLLAELESQCPRLCAVARYLPLRQNRADRGRQHERRIPLELKNVADKSMEPLDEVILRESYQLIHRALARLDEKEREIIELHTFQDLSYLEIADHLGLLEQLLANLRQRHKRAVDSLARQFHNFAGK